MSDTSTETFEIVFRGDIQFGQNLAEVKQRLQQLFKIDSAKVDALFTGRPVVLKRGLDKVSGEKYVDVLTKAGAMVDLVAAGTTQIKPPPVKSNSQVKVAAETNSKVETATAEVIKGTWTLAPVGTLLMPASARLAPVVRQFDLSVFSLRPAGGNLVDTNEAKRTNPEVLTVPDYKVAEVGANLIDASEKMELPLLEIDVEDWGLSEPGAQLLSENEKPKQVAPPNVNVDFSLAPAGSLLDQIKPKVEIKIPDTSGLKLVNE